MKNIRKATMADLDAIEKLYEAHHDFCAENGIDIGWVKGVYPTRESAKAAIEKDDMFVIYEGQGKGQNETAPDETALDETALAATARINQEQVDVYVGGDWLYPAKDHEVMVMHTLVVHPKYRGKGYARAFLEYYEKYALEHGCRCLRIDTGAINKNARSLYAKFGYREAGIFPTVFNGIPGINLVLLEKYLSD